MNPLVDVLKEMRNNKRSLISFNLQNIQHINILSELASTHNLPVIAQFSSKYIPYFERTIGLKSLVEKYRSENLFFHLDHCIDIETIKYCIDSGFNSVMYDGSSLPIQANINNTNDVFQLARKNDCLVEAELGAIGGVEDGFGTEEVAYYSEAELKLFSKEANFDLLALAIGNAHGVYNSIEHIKVELLEKADMLLPGSYFVLHGGTGMPDNMVERCINSGVVKINISTALKNETNRLYKEFMEKNNTFDELKLFGIMKQLEVFFLEYINKFTKTHVSSN